MSEAEPIYNRVGHREAALEMDVVMAAQEEGAPTNASEGYENLRRRYREAADEYTRPGDDEVPEKKEKKKTDIFDVAQEDSPAAMAKKARFLLETLSGTEDALEALDRAERGDATVNVQKILAIEGWKAFEGNEEALRQFILRMRQLKFDESAVLLEEKISAPIKVIRHDCLPVLNDFSMGTHNSCLGDNI